MTNLDKQKLTKNKNNNKIHKGQTHRKQTTAHTNEQTYAQKQKTANKQTNTHTHRHRLQAENNKQNQQHETT